MSGNDITFVARLRDQITGPAGKAQKSVEDLTKATEQASKQAQKSTQVTDKQTKALTEQEKALGWSIDSMGRMRDANKRWVSEANRAERAAKQQGEATRKRAQDAEKATSSLERAMRELTGTSRRMGMAFHSGWEEAERGPERAYRALQSSGRQMIAESHHLGRKVGTNISDGIEDALDKFDQSKVAQLMGGLTVAGGVLGALDRDTQSRATAAASNLDPTAVRSLVDPMYQSGYGADYQQVMDAAGAVTSSFELVPGDPETKRLLEDNLTLAQAFNLDPAKLAMSAKILADVDGSSLTEAQDIFAAALRNSPTHSRDEVLDAMNEYGAVLEGTGISAGALGYLLSESADSGVWAVDKQGDALKEFAVRTLDTGSKPISEAYSTLGLDQSSISARLQSGDMSVLNDTAQALLDIEDPALRAATALEIYGVPLEDLGPAQIEEQLQAWADLETQIGDTSGTVDDMQETMREGPGYEWSKAMRALSGAMVDVGDAVAPLISAVAPIISWLAKPLAGAAAGLTLYGIISRIPGGATLAKGAFKGLFRVLALTPLGRLVTFIGLAVSGLGELYDNSEKVRAVFDGVTDAIRDLVDMFDDLLERADQWASKKLGLEDQGTAKDANRELDVRPQWWQDTTRGWEEDLGVGVGWGTGEGWLRFLHGSQDDEDLPHHADGGWTASGAHKAILGEDGREFVVNHWASEKLASIPGALPAISKGKLPVHPTPVPVAARSTSASVPAIGELHVHNPAGMDGATFAREFSAMFTQHYATAEARKARTRELTYSTLTARGAR